VNHLLSLSSLKPARLAAAVALSTAAASLVGCGGSHPELGDFEIPSEVTVGDEVEATVSVYDDDGLGELLFTVRMESAETSHTAFHAEKASDDSKLGDLTLFLGFFVPGTYKVSVTVTDEDGDESNSVSAMVTANPEPGS
jgi:hypothetical protein